MNRRDLEILIQEGEGTTLEFKESLSGALSRELVAMANTIGGKILLGVRDDGTMAGVRDSNRLRAQVQDLARNCDPPVNILITPLDNILVISVRESENKPVQCSEGFFWRQGAATQKLTREEILDFFRFEGAVRFDMTPCPDFHYPQDFERDRYDTWLKLSGITGRLKTEDVLVNIEAAERSGGTLLFRNAGVLFFAKNVRHFFNQAYVTCLLAKGTDKVNILDRKDFDGGIVKDIEDALRFIERNTRTAYRIEQLRRENIPEYPMKALREAVTNAVMHRDWFMEGVNIFVEIYDDRIEVVSPGGLPKGMTLADLGTRSVRRNALIADLLHRIGYIEKAGTGVKRIREEARKGGYPLPTWEANDFVTTVFRPNPEVRHEVGQTWAQSGAQSGPSRDQVEILRNCLIEKALTDLLEIVGRTNRTKFRDQVLKPLLQAGWLEMTIPDKPRSSKQRYRLTEAGRTYLNNQQDEESADHVEG
ncbi:MAG TPA: ATP-binding protein [Thermoanaerobaculia bacterium]|nr:ATP-binding protein [Thermoanaerobaculia bacterium]HUM31163.1 ATP-binding protein [Thermoanaerobaculia bacterium]HXK69537.1 ATP-binding protein [Thermoanaerobaculia bacterium]